jgi:hypothetical protein
LEERLLEVLVVAGSVEHPLGVAVVRAHGELDGER